MNLPAQRVDADGRVHVDQRAVFALALPLMANSAVQIVLSLTDMWFIGHISTRALAAVGAVQWFVIVVVLLLGGAGNAVQTLVAQAFGARRYSRAAQALWTALWATACAAPLFVLVGAARHLILTPFGFEPRVEDLAASFWYPRVGGASAGAAVWALLGFFNGIGRPRITLLITLVTTFFNAALNQLFIFHLGWGIVGSAWATNCAQLLGLALGVVIFLFRLTIGVTRGGGGGGGGGGGAPAQLRLGVPMGLMLPVIRISLGFGDLPDDEDPARHHRRRRHAAGGHSHLARLHARLRHRERRHHPRRPVHRRRCARLGAAARHAGDLACGALHGRNRPRDCAGGPVAGAPVHRFP